MPTTRKPKQSDAGAILEAQAGAEDNSSPTLEKDLDIVLDSMNKRFDLLDEKLEALTQNQTVLMKRVDGLEDQGTDHERRIQALEESLAETRKLNDKLCAKVNDLEGRLRRNNIKIVGIPEGEEKGRPTEFVMSLIPKLFGENSFTKPVTVDRAHRVPLCSGGRTGGTQRPRSIIARIHFYQEKQLLIRLSREQKPTYNGVRVYVYPDYTAEVMALRRAFGEVTNTLREKGIQFVLHFPARLHVNYNDQYDHIPGPPRKSFLFGHSALVVEKLERGEPMYDLFLEWAQTYGPVYRFNVLHYVFIGVSCPEATKEILMSSKHPKEKYLYTRMVNLFGQRFFGHGLLTVLDHEQWHKQRRIMDPAFSSLYLRGLTGTFNERAEKMMERLSEEADSNTVANMLNLFSDLTMDVIAKIAYDVDLDLKYSSPVPKAIKTCLKGMSHYINDTTFKYKPQNWSFISEVREAIRLLRSTGAQWINARKTAINNGENVPKDILTQIFKSAGQEKNMTKEDEELLVDNVVTFFIAGQETTANELAFCVMELGRHPDILEKVKKEVDEVIGVKTEISYDDLGNLTYLSQVLKETLRLNPTAPATTRDLLEDMVIDGHHIPGGVTCMVRKNQHYTRGYAQSFI
ncbi:hypothetical protein WMY93_015736 [Mugilogobius chulae]|uniref:Uncharacterized protein n=1 Tax=Mugilogobius chulae TaxID=88201 RepID=A0AAW0P127_9GOBI